MFSRDTESFLELQGYDIKMIQYKEFLEEPLNESLSEFIDARHQEIENMKMNLKKELTNENN